jgi:hypothetical protein
MSRALPRRPVLELSPSKLFENGMIQSRSNLHLWRRLPSVNDLALVSLYGLVTWNMKTCLPPSLYTPALPSHDSLLRFHCCISDQ